MDYLLAAATSLEIQPFLEWLKSLPAANSKPLPDILITGIGLTSATYHLARQLSMKKYDW